MRTSMAVAMTLFGDWRPWEHGWISIREAADLLGVTKQNVHDLVRRGRIRAQRYSQHAMIVERASVDAYGRERAGKAKPGPRPTS